MQRLFKSAKAREKALTSALERATLARAKAATSGQYHRDRLQGLVGAGATKRMVSSALRASSTVTGTRR